MAALNGGLSVAAGAFGAHALKSRLDADLLAIFETGARYHMYHALAMLLAAAASPRLTPRGASIACWAFLAGILLFSGSLYVLALTGVRAWGAVTPFGGVAFLVGWIALASAAFRARNPGFPLTSPDCSVRPPPGSSSGG